MTRFVNHPWKAMVLVALGGLAFLRGCNCGDDPGGLSQIEPWSCEDEGRRPNEDDDPCGAGERFVKGTCQAERCDAEADGWVPGCCPGTVCTAGGLCQVRPSQVVLCETDDDCDTPGQHCIERARVNPEAKTCGFLPPNELGECPSGGQVFNARCIVEAPCGGACAAGSVCNIDTNSCEAPPSFAPEAAHGCDASCGAAQILVYKDPDAMLFDQCCEVTCECQTLPALAPGAWGRYSDMVLTDNSILVSGYDATYGDLVLGNFGRLSAELQDLDYIDGVPSSGPVVANPEGPRGGRDEPGPDVGTHTALAVQNGTPRIAYYDNEAKDLRYASFNAGSGTWTLSLIDDGRDATEADTGDVGRYTSLVIDGAGIAHVTYYAHRAQPNGVVMTGPMYARAKSQNPTGYDDWDRVPIEEVRSCDAACGANACVLDAGAPTCLAPTVGCNCACDQACVVTGGGAACRQKLPGRLDEPCGGDCESGFKCVDDDGVETCMLELDAGCGGCNEGELCIDDGDGVTPAPACKIETPFSRIEGVPEGVGLFTSLVLEGGVPVVVYYDRLRSHLRGAVASFPAGGDISGGFAPGAVACDPNEDFGQHASLALTPGGVAVAFQGEEGKNLWICTGTDLDDCGQNLELVDDGARQASASLVGAYASLVYDVAGDRYYIAYADQTQNDLVLSYGQPGNWGLTTLLADGAFGSFARLAIAGGVGYASTYLRARDSFDRDASHVVVHIFDPAELPAP